MRYIRLLLVNIWIKLSKYITSDKVYLKVYYFLYTREKLDFNNPTKFNEKIQCLKLLNNSPECSVMADKYEVRNYISTIFGDEILIPLIGVWDNFDEIDFSLFPNQFVLKTTHDSQSLIICTDKTKFNTLKAKKKLNRSLKRNYFYKGREYPYKDIKPRIIAEKYLVDESKSELKDYKLHCFHGKVQFIQVDFGRFTNHKRNIYNTSWELQDFEIQKPRDISYAISKPVVLSRMIEIAEIISKEMKYLRVDLYVVNDKIYFGEITFHHGGGIEEFRPKEMNCKIGYLISI